MKAIILCIVALGLAIFGCSSRPTIPVVTTKPIPAAIQPAADSPDGMRFVCVEPGEFAMGGDIPAEEIVVRFGGENPEYFAAEFPRHQVKIAGRYFIAVNDITRGQFARFISETQYRTTAEIKGTGFGWTTNGYGEVAGLDWRRPGFAQTNQHPVVQVSWDDAQQYCNWLSKNTGHKYRLPTEAEWEYACRAGTGTIFYWGDDLAPAGRYANLCDAATASWGNATIHNPFTFGVEWDDGFATTSPVGSFAANPWGLHDMLGNVWQWCDDLQRPYALDDRSGIPPQNSKVRRVVRGGAWDVSPAYCRSATRHSVPPVYRSCDLGFRVVREIPQP